MPGRDGTGPLGTGSMTGRGLGLCIGADAVRYSAGSGMGFGLGFACRRGFGGGFRRGFAADLTTDQKELLQAHKKVLQNRLEIIDKQLESL